jgi:hypothetical protein
MYPSGCFFMSVAQAGMGRRGDGSLLAATARSGGSIAVPPRADHWGRRHYRRTTPGLPEAHGPRCLPNVRRASRRRYSRRTRSELRITTPLRGMWPTSGPNVARAIPIATRLRSSRCCICAAFAGSCRHASSDVVFVGTPSKAGVTGSSPVLPIGDPQEMRGRSPA